MAIWGKPEKEDSYMMAVLRQAAKGYDARGNPISRPEQMAAIQQYQDIQNQKAQRLNEQARAESNAKLQAAQAEGERKRAEAERVRAETDAEVSRRRVAVEEDKLQLEAFQAAQLFELEATRVTERLQIEKSEVLVKALAVALEGGIDPDHILGLIQGLGQNLLPAPPAPLQLEDKDGEE